VNSDAYENLRSKVWGTNINPLASLFANPMDPDPWLRPMVQDILNEIADQFASLAVAHGETLAQNEGNPETYPGRDHYWMARTWEAAETMLRQWTEKTSDE
jgi:hypothetical protein